MKNRIERERSEKAYHNPADSVRHEERRLNTEGPQARRIIGPLREDHWKIDEVRRKKPWTRSSTMK